jgi:pSer/pThr/pTyr-binding forkhead associated (FHA) protein
MEGEGERLLLQGGRLLVIGGTEEALQEFISLEALPLRFGRTRDNDILLNHPLVSRTHCEIFEQDGRLLVRDLGSLNGTYVGNSRIEICELRPGDLLTVGVVTFRAVYGGYDYEASLDVLDEPAADAEFLDTQPIQGGEAERTKLHRSTRAHRKTKRPGDGDKTI